MKFSKICRGCGCLINDNKDFCYRCFQLKNYNHLVVDENLIGNANHYLESLNLKQSNLYLITDLFSLIHDIQYFANKKLNPINVIINKMDLLPQGFNFNLTNQLIKQTLKIAKLNVNKILYTSIYDVSNLKKLNDFLNEHNHYPNVFVGYSDVGKSSLINALLKLNQISDQLCLTSCYINTTNIMKVFNLKNYQLIDCPGIYDASNLLNYLQPQDVKKVIDYKYARPYQLQFYQSQRIYIEGLVVIDLLLKPNQHSTITLYVSPNLKIKRKNLTNQCPLNNSQATIHYNNVNEDKIYEFEINGNNYKTDFLIYGLGLIVIHKGVAKISIRVNKNVFVAQLPYALI